MGEMSDRRQIFLEKLAELDRLRIRREEAGTLVDILLKNYEARDISETSCDEARRKAYRLGYLRCIADVVDNLAHVNYEQQTMLLEMISWEIAETKKAED